MIFTGRPKARRKLNPTQPGARLCGSRSGRPCTTGAGYPIETTSYATSFTASLTCLTMTAGAISGPDGILIGSFIPEASTFTLVPPMSIANIFGLAELALDLDLESELRPAFFAWEFWLGFIG